MALMDLFARNPFKYNIEDKVMGYHIFRCFQFICGNIIGREHRGESNVYTIESEYGKDFSGDLFEGDIKPYDEKLVLEEIRRTVGNDKTRVLTVKVLEIDRSDQCGVSVIVEEKGNEVVREDIDGEDVEPGDLLKSYEKLLTYLGWKPDLDRMYLGDGLLVLNFLKDLEEKT